MIIVKALYGLRSSGARFHDKLADTLRSMGFFPCKADADVWMRERDDHWEYICCYVDDLMACMKHPQEFFDALQAAPHNYKLKGVGFPDYHLGGNFGRDKDGCLTWGATTYVGRILDNYKRRFGELPAKVSVTMKPGDSPELDTSPEVSDADIKVYQSLIGELQWLITLGRFDIQIAVMSLSRFRIAPKQGHLERVKNIYGYLRKQPQGTLRFRTKIPNNEAVFGDQEEHDWSQSVYLGSKEETNGFPTAKGKPVRTTTFVDANLMFCKITGRSCTGIMYLLNQTLIDTFSKKQNTVETATYGSEFVAARIATDQIIDLRYTLRAMGVPIEGPSWMLGDNESVITSSTIPHSMLEKRHNALNYHRVREALANKIIIFKHIRSEQNSSDVLTKYLPRHEAWPFVQTWLFWHGETHKAIASTHGE